MHTIEPYHLWRKYYKSESDHCSVFYGIRHSEFYYDKTVYNYYIHSQWDEFGSQTLYLKVLFVDYDVKYMIIELIGEWNDMLYNDIMYLKRQVIEEFMKLGITKFILCCESVFNFHALDDDYYQEWYEETMEENGWICLMDIRPHVMKEICKIRLNNYLILKSMEDTPNWRKMNPQDVFSHLNNYVEDNE